MSFRRQIIRVGLLTAGASALLFWISHHAEVSFADGLRYIREAQQIEHGDYAGGLFRAADHPLHPLVIVAAHAAVGGAGPYEWQTAAQVAAVGALVLAVLPLYLLGRDLFEDETAGWLTCVFVLANPVVGYVAVNVLSESTFLLFWAWGLWASVRFLREGRFAWLPWAIGFGALAYLTRPEGLLLHLALVGTLLVLPTLRRAQIHWPRWRAAVALLTLGPVAAVGPYVAIKGGLGTKPAVARVIGTMPQSPPEALERERPLPPDQSAVQTYAIASARVVKAVRGAVTWPLIPLSVLGMVVAYRGAGAGRRRAGVFLAAVVAGSAVALVRLHATGGYCTVRHALVPGLVFILYAAHGLSWVMKTAAVDAGKLGLGEGRLRPGPAVWGLLLAAGVAWPLTLARTPYTSSFAPYRMAGSWVAQQPDAGGRVLDLTDWSLYFANVPGFGIGGIDEAAGRHETRWVILREAHRQGHGRSGAVARSLLAGRQPVARYPENPAPHQLQVEIYDLATPPAVARGGAGAVHR